MTAPTDSNPFDSAEAYYAAYRPRYGDETIDYLRERFDLDASARVLDLGCGAGQLAVPLAAYVGEMVGMDPNEEMLRHARRLAEEAGTENSRWVVGSDADLVTHADDLDPLRLTTMGRSFHWMNQTRTLERLYELTEPGGGVALLTDREWLTKGTDAWQAGVYDLAVEYVDDVPDRADPETVEYDDPWDELLADHGFVDVETATFPVRREWDVDTIVGYVFSLSFCSPATFGDEKEAFEAALRAQLNGMGAEQFVQHSEVEMISGRKRGLSSGQ
jgi:SAM-dependent methyltransferase